jgi:hypothetical protein
LATIRQLIGAHANVNAKDQNGESVLDWALKFRDPAVIATLRAAGAKVLPGGQEIDDKTLSHAPLLRKHINPFGRYHFDLDRIGKPQAGAPAEILNGGFRLDVATTPCTSRTERSSVLSEADAEVLAGVEQSHSSQLPQIPVTGACFAPSAHWF